MSHCSAPCLSRVTTMQVFGADSLLPGLDENEIASKSPFGQNVIPPL